VAGQAAGAGLLPGMIREYVDLGFIAAAGDVFRAGAMTTLAALFGGAALFVESGFPVRRFRPRVIDVFVTSFASVRPDILRSVVGGSRRRPAPFAIVVSRR